MSRLLSTALTTALALAPAVFACDRDKTGAEIQAETNKAQQKASAEVEKASDQVRLTSALAENDFAKTREDYRHNLQSNVDELNRKLDELDESATKATGKAKDDLRARSGSLHAEADALAKDLRSLDTASVETFDATRARLDKEWKHLKADADRDASE
jgi:uncharacterized protein YPO0396